MTADRSLAPLLVLNQIGRADCCITLMQSHWTKAIGLHRTVLYVCRKYDCREETGRDDMRRKKGGKVMAAE